MSNKVKSLLFLTAFMATAFYYNTQVNQLDSDTVYQTEDFADVDMEINPFQEEPEDIRK